MDVDVDVDVDGARLAMAVPRVLIEGSAVPDSEEDMHQVFDHERLEVYELARQLNREIGTLLEELPRGSGESADNLKRAAKSITRNIAESCGRWSFGDRINSLDIARGSGAEVAASIDELVDYGFTTEERIRSIKQLAWRIVSMLVAFRRSLEKRAAK